MQEKDLMYQNQGMVTSLRIRKSLVMNSQSQNDQEEVKKVTLLAMSNVPAHWESQDRKSKIFVLFQ